MEETSDKNRSLGFIDSIIILITNIIIPIPILGDFIGNLICSFKQIIFVFGFTLILFIIILISGGSTINAGGGDQSGFTQTPKELIGYREAGYTDTNYPSKTPLGGNGIDWIEITAYYHDPDYLKQFGMVHDGDDIVPNENYYQNSQAYKLTGKVIVIATMTGKACSYGDTGVNGLSVTIVSDDNQNKTFYHHMSANFIPLNSCVYAHNGEPLGIMGHTGHATGDHVHYGVYKNENGHWVDYNPYDTLLN